MNPFHFWKMFTLATLFFGVFVFSQVIFQTQPTQVRAQGAGDIDDVMERFGGDFGFDIKSDIKQQNVQSANEQNREDIQIRLQEERNRAIEEANQNQANQSQANPAPPPVQTLNVSVTFTESTPPTPFSLNVDLQLGSTPLVPGQVLPIGTPVPISFNSVPVGAHVLTIKCNTGPGCYVVLSSFVNMTCSPTSFVGVNKINIGNTAISNCTVSAPPPPP